MLQVHKEYSKKINAVTHTAPHHADEIFATAMLEILFPVDLFRTRDQSIIDSTHAIVYDVGGEFNTEKKRFDHHQKGFSEIRPDGIVYSSAGLIWREYGVEIIKKLDETKEIDEETAQAVFTHVDHALIRGIDARDNGQGEKGDSMSVSAIISSFNVLWDENEDADSCFIKACKIASTILKREIKVAFSSVHGQQLVKEEIESADNTVLVMDTFIGGWMDAVLTSNNPKAADLLYAVFPAVDGNWNIQAIPPTTKDKMMQRKPFPKEWRGLKNNDLITISGVETAVFSHAGGFFAVTKTKKDAIILAEKAANH